LKRITATGSAENLTLSALDPGKQGLKLHHPSFLGGADRLSALDPGKQGLKHIAEIEADAEKFAFSA